MSYNNDCTLPKEYLEQQTEDGLESLPEMIRLLVNQAMQIERDKHLNAPSLMNAVTNGSGKKLTIESFQPLDVDSNFQ